MNAHGAGVAGGGAEDDGPLLELIARYRRRARLDLLVRYTGFGGAAAFVAAAVLWYLNTPSAVSIPGLLAAAAVVAAISAAAAWWSGPTTHDVAAALDRRLGLDDSVVAALQVREGDSPVASLIVAQALGRARAARADDVFPVQLRGPAAATGAGLCVFALTAAMAGSPLPGASRNISRGSSADAGPAHASGGPLANDASDDTGREARREPLDGGMRVADADNVAGSAAAAAPAPVSDTPSADTRHQEPRDAPGNPARNPAGAKGESTAGAQDANAASGSPAASARGGGNAAGGAGSSAGAGHDREAAAGGSSGAIAAGSRAGAGGVRGGALLGTAGPTTAATALSPRNMPYSTQAPRGQDRAAGSDDIPPELRAYVRRYFAAVRAASGRP